MRRSPTPIGSVSGAGEAQAAARHAVAAARGGEAGRFQGFCPTQSGTPKWWDVIVMPIRSGDGASERLLSVARDITEVKRAEANLTAANRFLDSLIDNLPIMVFIKDARTLRYVRQNRATLNLLGLSADDVIGKLDRDFLPAEQADFIAAKDREVLGAGRLVDIPEQSINFAAARSAHPAHHENADSRRERDSAIPPGHFRGHHRAQAGGRCDPGI